MDTQVNFNFDNYKKCGKCGEVKELSDFYVYKSRGVYSSYCKICKIEHSKQYREANLKAVSAQSKKYREEHKEYIAKRKALWYAKNRDRVLEVQRRYVEANREAINEAKRKHSKTPIGRYNDYKRKARGKGRDFELDFEIFKTLITSPCKYCGGTGYGVDRVDSSQGYTISNSVPCCSECNYSKRANIVEEWLPHLVRIIKHQGLL